MLFNLDRNLKQSILNEYKKEAFLHRQKKQQEKEQRIKEEQDYLNEIKKKEDESLKKLNQEKEIQKNNQLKYYQEILSNSSNRNSPKKDVVINNWGQSRNQSSPYQVNDNIYKKDSNINKYEVDYNRLSPEQKEKIYIRKDEDNMRKYLTDEQNKDEVSKYFIEEKLYRQKYYKDLVNSQYEESQRINKDRYGTNDILIVENKRKKYFNDVNAKRYDFGKSNLLHNPIVNPENNLGYNKYINYRLSQSNIFRNITDNNMNDINSKSIDVNNNSPLLTVPNEEYKSNRRIIKIKGNKDNYNSESNILENEKDESKNYFKDLNENYNIYTPKKDVYEINKNYENKYNNQSTNNGSILSQAVKSNFLI